MCVSQVPFGIRLASLVMLADSAWGWLVMAVIELLNDRRLGKDAIACLVQRKAMLQDVAKVAITVAASQFNTK